MVRRRERYDRERFIFFLQVLLLSLKAGGEGLNLVGGNHLFLCELSYNPQNEQQACDRIYRSQSTVLLR